MRLPSGTTEMVVVDKPSVGLMYEIPTVFVHRSHRRRNFAAAARFKTWNPIPRSG